MALLRGDRLVVRLPDARRLAAERYGRPDGLPIVALHGTPGSAAKFAMADGVARRLGIDLIALDRWGYGESDRHPCPSLAAFADDVSVFMERLGRRRFGAVGVSGGGPFAAAVAATLGARVTALALVSPVGPVSGLEPGPGFGAFHRFCFRTLPRLPGAVGLLFHGLRAVARASPVSAARLASARASRSDRRRVEVAEFREELGVIFRTGLGPGVDGPVTDMRLFSRRWDVSLDRIAAPTRIWLGGDDRNVPLAGVQRLAREIRGAELRVIPSAGHYWIVDGTDEVLTWLKAMHSGPCGA